MTRRILFLLCICLEGWGLSYAPIPDSVALELLQKSLGNQPSEHFHREVKRLPDKTVELLGLVSYPADYKKFASLAKDYGRYREWALKGINQNPHGGNYYVQILDLVLDPARKNVLLGSFSLKFPFFKDSFNRPFEVEVVETPGSVSVYGDTLPYDKGVIESAQAILKVFPAPNNKGIVWGFFKCVVKIRNRVLYEALPEKMILKESAERVQIVLDNYSAEEAKASDGIKSP